MKYFSIILVISIIFFGQSLRLTAQENDDFDRLLAGETIMLDWGDGYVDLNEGATNPPAAQLIRHFVSTMLIPAETDFNREYIINQVMVRMAPRSGFSSEQHYEGMSVRTIHWNAKHQTLLAQVERFYTSQSCVFGGITDVLEGINICVFDNETGTAKIMTTVLFYRDQFQIIFLPPLE